MATMVGVLGISSSSQAALLDQLDRLGTNLLTVSPGQQLGGGQAYLPQDAPLRIHRMASVTDVAVTGILGSETVRRTDFVPSYDTGGISVRTAALNLPATVGASLHAGVFLTTATEGEPAAVLGSYAARHLGITDLHHRVKVYLHGQWFRVVGILDPVALAPQLDDSVLIGFPIAEARLGFDGSYSTVYVRCLPDHTVEVQNVLARTADPANPEQVNVSRPSDVLAARAAAKSAYTSLVLGVGGVALLVGGVGIANIMLVAVMERRSEIGLRRALGATQGHVLLQFLGESLLLAALGGVVGVIVGSSISAGYSVYSQSPLVIPPLAAGGGLMAACVVGVVFGLYPAFHAARMAPTEALRTA